jgi:hypothetical protein
MDPYLEDESWSSFQTWMVVMIGRQLTSRCRPGHIALLNRRMVKDEIPIRPGGTPIPTSVPHSWVEIRRPRQRPLAIVIDVLTPTNQRKAGREEYLSRRNGLLEKPIHLVEIDLLRSGERAPVSGPLPRAPYFVCVSRYEDRSITEVWPIALSQPLPMIPIPLSPGDADAVLDLQLVMNTVYDDGAFGQIFDYREPPEVPLTPEQAAWVDEHLRAAGLRP